jgi:hypothetical protein
VLLANDASVLSDVYAGLSQDAIDEYLSVLGSTDALQAALNWYKANIA